MSTRPDVCTLSVMNINCKILAKTIVLPLLIYTRFFYEMVSEFLQQRGRGGFVPGGYYVRDSDWCKRHSTRTGCEGNWCLTPARHHRTPRRLLKVYTAAPLSVTTLKSTRDRLERESTCKAVSISSRSRSCVRSDCLYVLWRHITTTEHWRDTLALSATVHTGRLSLYFVFFPLGIC